MPPTNGSLEQPITKTTAHARTMDSELNGVLGLVKAPSSAELW
jgi:hypothetical protein